MRCGRCGVVVFLGKVLLSFFCVLKVTAVLCHQSQTELRQRAQDGRKRNTRRPAIKRSTDIESSCGREKARQKRGRKRKKGAGHTKRHATELQSSNYKTTSREHLNMLN